MRSYGKVSPRIWTGRLGHYMRGRHDLQTLVLYLATCPHQNLAGIYRLTTGYIRDDTGIPEEDCQQLLGELVDFGYIHWDPGAGVVWVVDHARHELSRKASQQQRIAVGRVLDDFAISSVVIGFAQRYPEYLPDGFDIDRLSHRVSESSSIPSLSPSPSPSPSPTTTVGEASASPTNNHHGKKDATKSKPPPPSPILTYPCRGNPQEWELTEEQVEEWSALYPGVPILHNCRKALAWCSANPTKRKTARGMPKFLVNWLNKEADKGVRGVTGSPSTSPGTGTHNKGSSDQLRAEAERLEAEDRELEQ